MSWFLFTLLVVFQVKHYVADYALQTKYMLGKNRDDWGFFLPLVTHSAIHAICTLFICLIFNRSLWWLAIVDLIVHFLMDRMKDGHAYLGRFNDKDRSSYWRIFGLDQMVHHLTHIVFIWVLVTF